MRDGDPVVRELQFLQPAMFEAKYKLGGHKLYDDLSEISVKLQEEADARRREDLEEQGKQAARSMTDLYRSASVQDHAKAGLSGTFLGSSSDAIRPNSRIASQSANGLPADASSFSINSASELLAEKAATYVSEYSRSASDIAASFFSDSGDILSPSNRNILPSEGERQEGERIESDPTLKDADTASAEGSADTAERQNNLDAIELAKKIEDEGRTATTEEHSRLFLDK